MKKALIIPLLFAANFVFGQSQEFNDLQMKINALISKEQWDELVITAPELIIADPTKGDGYYYTALAFAKFGEAKKATEYLTLAEPLADDNLKKKIEHLKIEIDNIGKAKEIIAKIDDSKDNNQRSADDYKALWDLDKQNVSNALNAIDIYIEKEDYQKALVILNDPTFEKDDQAKKLITRLNATPKMKKLNAYYNAIKAGEAYEKQENYSAAIDQYNLALKEFSNERNASLKKQKATEELAYQSARKENTIQALENYLRKYPKGIYKERVDGILQRSYLKYARESNSSTKYDFDKARNFYNQYYSRYPYGPEVKVVKEELGLLHSKQAKKMEALNEIGTLTEAIKQYELAKSFGTPVPKASHIHSLNGKIKRWSRPDISIFSWHADEVNLIGFTAGSLNNRKLGMHFSARTSSDQFESATSNWQTTDDHELPDDNKGQYVYNNRTINRQIFVTLGITKKIAYPLWISVGGGVLINSQLKEFESTAQSKSLSLMVNKDQQYVSFNPEVRLFVPLGPVVFHYGINKPLAKQFKKDFIQHFGAGFTF